MKIGILTQPLYCNYGGLVQCYALQTILQRMGHETVVLQREFNRRHTLKGACIYYVKHIAKKLTGRRSSWHYYVSQKRRDYIAKNTYRFIDTYINPRSRKCHTTEELRNEVDRLQLDAIIVGSDQVWRPYYSPCQPNYFLDFLSKDSTIKRVSYAASFGCDEWTFTKELTDVCGELLHRFDGVSVREQSAVHLCKEHFGVDAVHVLDPTLLLEQDDYRKIACPVKQRGQLFCYILDKSEEKRQMVLTIGNMSGLKPFESMPELSDEITNLYGDIDRCVFPPVENWLSAFMEADMVLTDSFHGTVFSIIFNKPFWVVGNEGRGMARFESLLESFCLRDRLISPTSLENININQTVDWVDVNRRKSTLREYSLNFLRSFLKENNL